MVIAYWLIGREIVEEEQHGKARAEYGKRLIEDISRCLTERYGKGFSVANIRNFRQFYITYQDRTPEIHYPAGSELNIGVPNDQTLENRYPWGGESMAGFHPDLSWSHYRALAESNNDMLGLPRIFLARDIATVILYFYLFMNWADCLCPAGPG